MATATVRRRRPWRPALIRLGGALVALWLVATVAFGVLQLLPGDPAEAALGGPGSQASAAALQAAREQYGLDRPLPVQYLAYLGRVLTGDLGTSYSHRAPVTEVMAPLIGPTLTLAVLALLCAWLLALGTAMVATGTSRLAARVASAVEIVASVLPGFWLASVLIIVFATHLGWFPPVSDATPRGLVLPVLSLAVPLAGYLSQTMREAMLTALDSPFALAARTRGESRWGLRVRHALRHGLVPGINLSGWSFGYLISGAVVIETVFARPGLGRSLVSAVTSRDVPLVLGVTLFAALGYVLVTMAADALTAAVDTRGAS
ncbi:ABC transporter permease [Kocuria sp.]|uniref:ABC transporter permease n=1 Tax=Kocuria sp. TaxID=1871328 RepID=UPI0026475C73|nr:ABC transporter permease [Kocuria sp.]MDN5630346.1 ABC transporter permease [Kocuria sp.]